MNNLPDTAARGRVETRRHGQRSLSDRVRSLRLQAGGAGARPRSTWLPWGLTVIALALAAVFGWRAYRLSPGEVASTPTPSNSTAGPTPSAAIETPAPANAGD